MNEAALEDTAAGFAWEQAEREFIIEVARTLGWKVMQQSGIGRPDMMLIRNAVIPVFLKGRAMGPARQRAWDAFLLAGLIPRRWGRQDVRQMRVVLQ